MGCVAAKNHTSTLSRSTSFLSSDPQRVCLSGTQKHVLTSMTSSICDGALLLLLLHATLQDLPVAGGIRRADRPSETGRRLHTVRPQ